MPLREPAVSRQTLTLTAGSVWLLVGLFLISRALFWLPQVKSTLYFPVAIGVALGIAKGYWVFARLARRNIARIAALSPHKERICVFAFQALESYLIVIVMITLGIALRLSPLSRDILVAIYLLVGVALAVGSISYFRNAFASR